MSEVPSWPGCVRPTMSGSLARGRRPSAEGRGAHGAGVAPRRADACRRFAFGRVTREDNAPTHRKAGPSSGLSEPSRRTRGASLAPDPASPAVRVPRRSFPRRPRAVGGALAMLFALAALTLAVPSTAQAQNATGAPGITGTATVGQTLTATQGTIADPHGLSPVSWFSNATTTFQWIQVDSGTDSDISGAMARTYTLVTADAGKQIKVKVDFTDDNGHAESLTSAAYPADGTVLAISGTNNPPFSINSTVRATEDTDYSFAQSDFSFSETDPGDRFVALKIVTLPLGTLSLSATPITSGDLPKTVTAAELQGGNLTYSPPANASGNDADSFTFRVNDGTDDSVLVYTQSIHLTAVNDAATGKPGITGTAQVGQTLTATVGDITDLEGLPDPFFSNASTTVQWIRVDGGSDSDISGETAGTYTLVTADAGKQIKVKVDFADDIGFGESRTSDAYPAGGTVLAFDTTAPTLTRATILAGGQIIELQLSENVQRSNLPLVSAFTVTAGGSDVTLTLVLVPAALDTYWISVPSSSVIRQGQVVVVTYTDPTSGDDVRAIQDVRRSILPTADCCRLGCGLQNADDLYRFGGPPPSRSLVAPDHRSPEYFDCSYSTVGVDCDP